MADGIDVRTTDLVRSCNIFNNVKDVYALEAICHFNTAKIGHSLTGCGYSQYCLLECLPVHTATELHLSCPKYIYPS